MIRWAFVRETFTVVVDWRSVMDPLEIVAILAVCFALMIVIGTTNKWGGGW